MPRTVGLRNYSDVHYTNDDTAKTVCEHFPIKGLILEPACGNGVFLKYLPETTEWCEIAKGRDFFQRTDKVDWIVTNPPFEHLTNWMEKSFDIAANVVFLIPLSKLFSSAPRMQQVFNYGGIREMLYLGTGRSIGFDIGFPFAAVWFQRDYKGPTYISRSRTQS